MDMPVINLPGLFLLFLLGSCMSPPANSCVLAHCKDKASTRTYIINTHRQKIGDLYQPGSGQRTQIRDTSRRIIGYIEMDGSVTNTHRQKKGQINE